MTKKITKSFSENKNQNHADEDLILLSDSADACITDNSNSHTSGKTT